jgi:erythromycin esterase
MNDKRSFTEWVANHAVTTRSLDPQAPLDDLEPLGELIGDARVVGIGESAHYVREFYLLRHRLLRFLVQWWASPSSLNTADLRVSAW